MSVRIPHGQQPDPLDDLLDQILDEVAKKNLFIEKISSYSSSGGEEFVVTFREAPLRMAATGPTGPRVLPGPIGPTGATGATRSHAGAGSVKHLGTSRHLITGYRDFDLVSLHDGFILTSRNNAYWRPRKKMVAYCTARGLAADHDAPGEHCDCGIYAFSRPDDPDLISQNKVWGEIAMWGEVLICETGYRAEYAYPTNLFMRDTGTKGVRHVADELEQMYGVPVFLVRERQGKTAAQIMEEILAQDPLAMWLDRWGVSMQAELDQDTIDKLLRPDD